MEVKHSFLHLKYHLQNGCVIESRTASRHEHQLERQISGDVCAHDTNKVFQCFHNILSIALSGHSWPTGFSRGATQIFHLLKHL